MSSQFNFKNLLLKYQIEIGRSYSKQSDFEILEDYANSDEIEFTKKLESELKTIEFSNLSYTEKLKYIFIQFTIKEINFLNSPANASGKEVKVLQSLNNIFFPKKIRDYILSGTILTDSFQSLSEKLDSYRKNLETINLSVLTLSNNGNHFIFNFITYLSDLLREISDKLGSSLTSKELLEIKNELKQIQEDLRKSQSTILRNISQSKEFVQKNINDLLKMISELHEYPFDIDIDIIIESVSKLKNEFFVKLTQISKNQYSDQTISDIYKIFIKKIGLNNKDKRQIIEESIKNVQNWLKINNFIENPVLFPIIFQNLTFLNYKWTSEPVIEKVLKDNSIKGLKIGLFPSNKEILKNTTQINSRWALQLFSLKNLFPGIYYLLKVFQEDQSTHEMLIRGSITFERWNLLILSILIDKNYFTEPQDNFFSLWSLYKHYSYLDASLAVYRGESITSKCLKICGELGIEFELCAQELQQYQNNFYEKLVITMDSLILLYILKLFEEKALPIQRFLQVIEKNFSSPIKILIQLFEKFTQTNLKEINKDIVEIFFQQGS